MARPLPQKGGKRWGTAPDPRQGVYPLHPCFSIDVGQSSNLQIGCFKSTAHQYRQTALRIDNMLTLCNTRALHISPPSRSPLREDNSDYLTSPVTSKAPFSGGLFVGHCSLSQEGKRATKNRGTEFYFHQCPRLRVSTICLLPRLRRRRSSRNGHNAAMGPSSDVDKERAKASHSKVRLRTHTHREGITIEVIASGQMQKTQAARDCVISHSVCPLLS